MYGERRTGQTCERRTGRFMMDDQTVRRLNAINRDFYRRVAEDFDTTRGRPWPGWRRLLPYLPKAPEPLRVLDAGCGNGRLGMFLASALRQRIAYTGVDNNPALLARARETLVSPKLLSVELLEADLLNDTLPPGPYDLIGLFGVLHHIPAFERRQTLMRQLSARLAPGGVLAFACWCFYEYERFRERIVPWPAGLRVEPGDYLLDWRRGARTLRYCHYIDDAEHDALVAASGLAHVTSYRADGHEGDANLYTVLRRER